MITLRRIGVRSAGRVAFFFGLATSLVNVIFAIFMIVVIQGVPISVFPPEIWMQIAINIVLSSLVMAVGVGIFAFIYNLNPSFGALELEFDTDGTAIGKRKNDEIIDIDEID